MEEKYILSEEENIIKFSKNVEMINDYLSIDVNDKKIITKIYSMLKNKSIEEYEKYSSMVEKITEYVQDIIYDESLELVQMGTIDPIDIFKSVNLKIEIDSENILDSLVEYIMLLTEYLGVKMITFVNLKEFFTKKEVLYIYNAMIMKKIKFLVVESGNSTRYEEREKFYIFDEDYCEI